MTILAFRDAATWLLYSRNSGSNEKTNLFLSARLGNMDLRFVEEEDPIRQTLLEVYVAVTLKTPYNDFDNH